MTHDFRGKCIVTGKEETVTATYEKSTNLEGETHYYVADQFTCSYASEPGNVCDKQSECDLCKQASNYV